MRSFDAVDGFFIDEMSYDAAQINYYGCVYSYVKGLNGGYLVVGNPGTDTQELYVSLPTADIVVNFELGPKPYRRWTPRAWVNDYPSSRFAHLVYNVGTLDTAVSFLDLAVKKHAAHVYFTSDKLSPNPWDTLPAYWDGLVSEVCRRNGGTNC